MFQIPGLNELVQAAQLVMWIVITILAGMLIWALLKTIFAISYALRILKSLQEIIDLLKSIRRADEPTQGTNTPEEANMATPHTPADPGTAAPPTHNRAIGNAVTRQRSVPPWIVTVLKAVAIIIAWLAIFRILNPLLGTGRMLVLLEYVIVPVMTLMIWFLIRALRTKI